MKYSYITRIRIISVFIVFLAVLLLTRLFYVQVVDGDKYQRLGDSQYVTYADEVFSRGNIYFKERDGNLISAATLKSGFILAINPTLLTDIVDAYEKINEIIPIDRETFMHRASKTTDPYEEILDRVEGADAEKIEDLGLDGIGLYKTQWRFYPGGELASHALGFVGFSGDDFSGRYGIERYYNEVLERSMDGLYVNFFAEIFSNLGSLLTSQNIKKEGDIILTIEPIVQNFLESKLQEVSKKWNAKEVGGIIIEPKTGRITALASLPNFNPQTYGEAKDISIFSNPITESVYEFGSVIKPLTIASALDSGAITELTTYVDKGYVELDNERIENFDGVGRGVVLIQEILSQSLNTGVVFAMQQMGKDTFRDYFYKLGFGKRTNIDLPDEVNGIVNNLESSRTIEYATASFGQGIAFSPISATRALSALANGGYLVRPHIVDTIDYNGFPKREVKTEEQRKVFKQSTTETITSMLVEVVDEALLGGSVKMDNYSIAAKTGTAQIADNVEGGYYSDQFLHSFFGYFPAYSAEYLVFLYAIDPRGVRYASQTLTAPFMDITQFLINHYEISPDR